MQLTGGNVIVIIDNYDSFTHNLYQYLAEITDEEIQVHRNDAITISQLEALHPSYIIISPGPGRPENAGISLSVVKAFAGRAPILGVCLGHQVIVEAFGGRIVTAKDIMHGKTANISLDGKGLFRSIRSPATFVRYHSLAAAKKLSTDLEVSAWSSDGEIMGVRHKTHVIEGVQFHPESIASPDGKKLLANFLRYRREAFSPLLHLQRITEGNNLSQHDAENFMEELTDGNLDDVQIGSFLTAMLTKGITAEEVVGCAAVLRRKKKQIRLSVPVIDTCGTGGDELGTFNISSMSALIAASCGVSVAKHGNRGVSSRSGSSDFFAALGVNIDMSETQMHKCLEEANFIYMHAPYYHSGMRFAASARKKLGMKTIMNLLGPLVNPADAEYSLMGVFSDKYQRIMAEAAAVLGIRRGMIVHGLDGQDEFSVSSATRVLFLDTDGTLDENEVTPQDFGLKQHSLSSLSGGNAADNAKIAVALLHANKKERLSTKRYEALCDAVALNAGAALYIYGAAESIARGIEHARDALETQKTLRTLETLIRISHTEQDNG